MKQDHAVHTKKLHAHETWNKILLLLLVIALNSFGYRAAQILNPGGVLTTTKIDAYIPFIPIFVAAYALYPIIVLLPFALYWRNYPAYKRMALSLAAALAISLAIYTLFQTAVVREPIPPVHELQFTDDPFLWGVAFVYALDPPVNALPSLHVALPTLAALFVWQQDKKMRKMVATGALVVVCSTVLIKQHAFVDVVAGLALASIVFTLARNQKIRSKATKK